MIACIMADSHSDNMVFVYEPIAGFDLGTLGYHMLVSTGCDTHCGQDLPQPVIEYLGEAESTWSP